MDGMKEWKRGNELEKEELDAVADLVGTFAAIPPGTSVDDWAEEPAVKEHPGFNPFVESCLNCHTVGRLGSKSKSRRAPDLFAYGSPQWLSRMVRQPGSKHNYGFLGARQPMPSFDESQMSENDLTTLVRFIKNDFAR
jgi:ubiquinol-cytochrome c reductase cytochrome b subunit